MPQWHAVIEECEKADLLLRCTMHIERFPSLFFSMRLRRTEESRFLKFLQSIIIIFNDTNILLVVNASFAPSSHRYRRCILREYRFCQWNGNLQSQWYPGFYYCTFVTFEVFVPCSLRNRSHVTSLCIAYNCWWEKRIYTRRTEFWTVMIEISISHLTWQEWFLAPLLAC